MMAAGLLTSAIIASMLLFGCVKSFDDSVWNYLDTVLREASRHRLSDDEVQTLGRKSLNEEQFKSQLLNPFMKVRVPGTPAHDEVRDHIAQAMRNLSYTVEEDTFREDTPLGNIEFTNVLATQNPDAERRITLACHYDSKYFEHGEFLGMTDSAVPCAMLVDLARVLNQYIPQSRRNQENDLSLQLIFFDGEEAFRHWTDTDSLYGARHLARLMEHRQKELRRELTQSDLQRMDIFILLDLIGARNPTFKDWFPATSRTFNEMGRIERRLAGLSMLRPTSRFSSRSNKIFIGGTMRGRVQDDHVPFLERGVPVLHLITHPFPSVWHEISDNMDAFDYTSVDNISKILRVYLAQALALSIPS